MGGEWMLNVVREKKPACEGLHENPDAACFTQGY
jgi:hypothetical protein